MAILPQLLPSLFLKPGAATERWWGQLTSLTLWSSSLELKQPRCGFRFFFTPALTLHLFYGCDFWIRFTSWSIGLIEWVKTRTHYATKEEIEVQILLLLFPTLQMFAATSSFMGFWGLKLHACWRGALQPHLSWYSTISRRWFFFIFLYFLGHFCFRWGSK